MQKKGQKRKLAGTMIQNLKMLRKNHAWQQDFLMYLWKKKTLQCYSPTGI